MQSNQISRDVIKAFLNENDITFFDTLTEEEQVFIQLILLSEPQALTIDVSFPKITFLVSQLEFNSSDTKIVDAINNLTTKNLQISLCLDEILNDAQQPGYDHLLQFDINKHRNEDDIQFSLELYRWRYQLRPTLLKTLSSKLKQSCSDEIPYFKLLENLNYVYEQNENEVFEVIKVLMPHLSYRGEIEKAIKEVCSPAIENLFKKAIMVLESEQGFVLRAFANSYEEEARFLVELIGYPDIKPVDLMGNTPLHLVNRVCLLPLAFAITPDIDQVNSDGNTALHTAMILSDEQKVNFLLLKGARTDIENAKKETCWTIPSMAPNSELELYRLYVLTGHIISYCAIPANQVGLCCGLYAAALLINYNNFLYPEIVEQDAIARKCDTNNAKEKVSLREIAKKKGYTKVGEIFSMDALAELINMANCPTEVPTIQDYTHFISVLQKASMRKQMVIIPFCFAENDPYKGNTPLDATKAHIATCIGLRTDLNGEHFCLLAHHGRYQEINAKGLFYAFFNVPEKMPTIYFHKIKKDWQESLQPRWDNLRLPCRKIYATDLSLFRRRLLVGLTPDERKPQVSADPAVQPLMKTDPRQDIQPKKRSKIF